MRAFSLGVKMTHVAMFTTHWLSAFWVSYAVKLNDRTPRSSCAPFINTEQFCCRKKTHAIPGESTTNDLPKSLNFRKLESIIATTRSQQLITFSTSPSIKITERLVNIGLIVLFFSRNVMDIQWWLVQTRKSGGGARPRDEGVGIWSWWHFVINIVDGANQKKVQCNH